MWTFNLTHWISHPEELNRETLYELRTFLARYPYCQSVRLLFLKNLYLLHDITFGQELRKAALYVGDRRKLFYLLEGEIFFAKSFTNEPVTDTSLSKEPGLDRTLSLIDSFLSSMPVDERVNIQVDNFNQISDYTSFLEAHEPVDGDIGEKDEIIHNPALRGQELIDSFIIKAETESVMLKPEDRESHDDSDSGIIPETPDTDYPEDGDETFFTETLAKIYIKQHRYDKALEIIKKLSLKYPKKNAYFADQIRFLEKVIINAKTK